MEMICLDTNILISHKRSKQKNTIRLYKLSTQYSFAVTSITAYELFTGDNSAEDAFWLNFFSKIIMLDFNQSSAMEGGKIYKDLKSKGLMIDIEDILIGAIAISNSLKLATDNINHFGRISGLQII
ncbi:MAG: PilT protein domain protein [Segetibacter sp.]|nr:PilT protein domain protein [Segetibacter sp.]